MYARMLVFSATGAIALGLVGCVTGPSDPQVESAAAKAIGLPAGEPIAFRSDADPTDKGEIANGLSLADAVRLSAQRSAEVQAALSRVRIAQAEAKHARLLPNPIVTLAVRFPEGGGQPIVDAGLTADLITILRRPGSIRSADASLRATCSAAIGVVVDIAASAQESYIAVQADEQLLVVLRQRAELLDQLLALSESRLNLGEGTRLEVMTIQAQQVELKAEIAELQLQIREARIALARLLGVPLSDANWTLTSLTPSDFMLFDEELCLRTAMIAHPEVQRREWELIALGEQRRLAVWDVLGGTDAGLAAEHDNNWSIGPSASAPLPVFDSGIATRERATAAVIEARHHLVATRRLVIENVRRAFSSVALTRQNLDRVRDELVLLQTRRLELAEAHFRAGETDLTSLLIAEQELSTARAKLISLNRRAALAHVRLMQSVGGAGALAAMTPSIESVATTTQPAQ